MAVGTVAEVTGEGIPVPPEVEALLPTPEDVAFYEEHGYWVSGKILPDELVDAAVDGAERHWRGERDWPLPASGHFSDWKPSDGDTIRNSEYVSLQNREIRALVHYPVIGMIAARLSRSSVVRLWDDQLVSKPPATGPAGPVVGWHSDRAYWMTCTSPDMLTAWIPLHDCPLEMGPVMYIDGSHRWPISETMRHFNLADLDAVQERTMGRDVDSLKRVIAAEKGQVSFHHSRLIHASEVNRSTRPRTAIALHMQDERNRYRVYLNEQGEPWRLPNDDMCRTGPDGLPDYTDPAVFPVLYGPGRDPLV
jgi:ectoine hydroxylase-related dioxygenase (phytanoyl-CoA dioxygenase family)